MVKLLMLLLQDRVSLLLRGAVALQLPLPLASLHAVLGLLLSLLLIAAVLSLIGLHGLRLDNAGRGLAGCNMACRLLALLLLLLLLLLALLMIQRRLELLKGDDGDVVLSGVLELGPLAPVGGCLHDQ